MDQIRAQENAEATRFLFRASPISECLGESDESEQGVFSEKSGDEPSDRTSRSRSRRRGSDSDENRDRPASVSLLQQHVSLKSIHGRSPLTDVTNIGKGKDVETVSVSHVSDRWCTPSQLSSPRPCAPIEEQWEDGSKVRDDFHTGPRLRQTINLSRALFPEDTVAVQVAAPPGESPVPTFLEISGEVTSVAIEEEFQSWGHSDIDSLLLHRLHGDSPTVVVDVEPNGTRFFVLLWEDVTSTFLWHEIGTRPSTWSELDFMRIFNIFGLLASAMASRSFLRFSIWNAPCVGCGMGIPSEVCGAHPVAMAKLLYPQLLKLALHGQEALIHKGGRLAVAHKKGPTYECSSYRSLLVSSRAGKSIHRALRQHQQSLYTTYLQSQQVGGRPRIPVNFGVHMVRSHLRACAGQLALGGRWDDHTLAAMAARLHLDADAVHDLRCRLAEPDALARAGVPEFHRKYLQALHVDTNFHLADQDHGERVRTTFGSRPGDSFADVVFGYLWARVLHQLKASMIELGLLTYTYPVLNNVVSLRT